jgi:hypothetical protein
MKPLLWIYVGLYAALALWSIREHLSRDQPAWKALLDTVCSALGLGGMCLFLTGEADPRISAVWAYVFPLLMVEEAIDLRFELTHWRSLLWVMLAGGVLFAVPYYWMNFQVAFGG